MKYSNQFTCYNNTMQYCSQWSGFEETSNYWENDTFTCTNTTNTQCNEWVGIHKKTKKCIRSVYTIPETYTNICKHLFFDTYYMQKIEYSYTVSKCLTLYPCNYWYTKTYNEIGTTPVYEYYTCGIYIPKTLVCMYWNSTNIMCNCVKYNYLSCQIWECFSILEYVNIFNIFVIINICLLFIFCLRIKKYLKNISRKFICTLVLYQYLTDLTV